MNVANGGGARHRHARQIDVNSGVEQTPGIKSPAKLRAFVSGLVNATKPE